MQTYINVINFYETHSQNVWIQMISKWKIVFFYEHSVQ